ncbi:hypothetical protein MMYC01_205514 [Madurella mycetomatis]|uniref:Uncharacterized protein n=1 Tax=Madurella mycetomatis TaxID=100816 RepID=A0A175W3A1_9PEZI|nr:hypothetical protein MMYC01_205514 [Madurella mycetomatis]
MRVFSSLPSSLAVLFASSLLANHVQAGSHVPIWRSLWARKPSLDTSYGGGTSHDTSSGSEAGSDSKHSSNSNLVVTMGSTSISEPGGQCSWNDITSAPIIEFPGAEKNRTYIAMGMELSVNLTSLDPLDILASSNIYLSYIQSGLQARSADNPVLISEVNPIVPFQMTSEGGEQPQMLIILLYVQPHPLVIEQRYKLAFSGMKLDADKRQGFNFEAFCESAAITNMKGSTWIVVNGTASEIGGGDEPKTTAPPLTTTGLASDNCTTTTAAGGGGYQVTTIITSDAFGLPTVITTTLSPGVLPSSGAVPTGTAGYPGFGSSSSSSSDSDTCEPTTVTVTVTVTATVDQDGDDTDVTVPPATTTAGAGGGWYGGNWTYPGGGSHGTGTVIDTTTTSDGGGGLNATIPITSGTPTRTRPRTTATKLTAVYPIPDPPCSTCIPTGTGAIPGTGTGGVRPTGTGGYPVPTTSLGFPVVGGASKDAPSRGLISMLLSSVALISFVFL